MIESYVLPQEEIGIRLLMKEYPFCDKGVPSHINQASSAYFFNKTDVLSFQSKGISLTIKDVSSFSIKGNTFFT